MREATIGPCSLCGPVRLIAFSKLLNCEALVKKL